MGDKKRAYDGNGDTSATKKLKSDTKPNAAAAALNAAEVIAAKRAEVLAKHAAILKSTSTATAAAAAGVPPKPTFAAPIPQKPTVPLPSVLETSSPASRASATPSHGAPSVSTTPMSLSTQEDLARKVAEAKRKVAEAQSKLANKDNPYLALAGQGSKKPSKQQTPTEPVQQGAGLKMAAHPLLLDTTPTPALNQSKKDKYKPMQPKFASIKANARNVPTPPPAAPTPTVTPVAANPYAAAAASTSIDSGFEGAPRERMGRSFKFVQKGKYTSLGNQMRHDAQLEALKQRIAESARKAGLDGEMGVEKGLKRPPPPLTEWWDATLLPNRTYDDLTYGLENMCIHGDSSPITPLIQHPIPIAPPGEKNKIELKPLMLTTRERKKMRKLRRQEALRDKNDRIRMGLLPPDPPKVRISNLMKVLTSDAIQDPTRVEARVRREVAMRKHNHDKMNTERKLTDEQRREKKDQKKVEEEKRGIYAAVFRVLNLTDPSHQFKVRRNAEQCNLSGVCIFNPQFNLIYVEGAHKFIKYYKRLMVHRIAWTESARPRAGAEEVEVENRDSDADSEDSDDEGSVSKHKPAPTAVVAPAVNGDDSASANGHLLDNNKCHLIWEGQVRDRAFTNFRGKECTTDREARDILGEKLKGYWDLGKNWKEEEEELY